MSEHSYAVPQFEGFAQFYDQFMLRLVNYPAWVDYLLKIFDKYQTPVQTILDLACGTGIPSLLLAQKGFRLTSIDASQPMLDVFRKKLARNNYDIRLINADLKNFSVPQQADAAISLYDSINYLLAEQDLFSCFKCVFENLKPGGLFVFDMNTIYCLESFWDNRETPRRVGSIYSIWRNSYDSQARVSTLKLTVYTDDGRVFEETHRERGYTYEEIQHNLQKAGFDKVQFYSHLTFLAPTDATLRIMTVACK